MSTFKWLKGDQISGRSAYYDFMLGFQHRHPKFMEILETYYYND